MIPRITRGSSAYGALSYDHGPGRADEHHNPHKVAGNVAGRTWKQRSATIDAHVQRMHPKLTNPIIRTSLRIAPDDRRLTDREWRDIANEYVDRMGFGNAPWEAVRHADDHIHLTMSRVNWDGSVVDQWRDKTKAQSAVRDIERRHRLVDASTRYSRDIPQVSRNDRERADRLSTATGSAVDPERVTLRERIDAAENASNGSRSDFEAKLAERGVQARANMSKPTECNPDGRMNGYSYRLDGHTDGAGKPVWFKGSKLGRRYGWAQTEHRLNEQRARHSDATDSLDAESIPRPASLDQQTNRPTATPDTKPVGTVTPLDSKKDRNSRDRADAAETKGHESLDTNASEHHGKGRPNSSAEENTTTAAREHSSDTKSERVHQARSAEPDLAAGHEQRDNGPDAPQDRAATTRSAQRDESTYEGTQRQETDPTGRHEDDSHRNPAQNQSPDRRVHSPDNGKSGVGQEHHTQQRDGAEDTRERHQERSLGDRRTEVDAQPGSHETPPKTSERHETRRDQNTTTRSDTATAREAEAHSSSSERDRAQQRAEQWRRDRAARRNQPRDRHDEPQRRPVSSGRPDPHSDVGGARDDKRSSRDAPRSQPSPDRPERSQGKDAMSTPEKTGRDPDSAAAAKQRSRERAEQWAQDRKERTQDRDRDKGRDR